jgi:SAM-dependent methyltransferase
MNLELLSSFVSAYPAQPATALWRAVEIDAIRRNGLPKGLGLDVGCGDGKLTRIILDLAGHRDLVGVDPDPLETAAARESGIYRAVHTTSAAAVPYANASFDWALSNSVLEHIPDLEPVIAEVARVLKPGGPFVITVPTVGFHRNLAGPLLPGAGRAEYLENLDARLAHFHYFGTDEWRSLLERNGLALEHRFGYLDGTECRRWETYSRLTGGLLYSLAGHRSRPIEIQRSLGLRAAQNRIGWPASIARTLARVFASGLIASPAYWNRAEGLTDDEAGCLLLVARRL